MMTQDFDKILDFSKGNVLVYNAFYWRWFGEIYIWR